MLPLEFKAPWSRPLRVATITSVVVLLAIAVAGSFVSLRQIPTLQIAIIGIPLLILCGALPFMVFGYTLTAHDIQIRRLGWVTKLPLASLMAIEGKEDAMQGSIRLFANGGLFSLTGYFWSRQLKFYRAYATDPSRAVILRYPNRTIVITPHDPQQFIVRTRMLLKTTALHS